MNNELAKKLLEHVGHDIAIMVYGDGINIFDVCVECLDCNEVLVSAECEEEE